MPPNLAGPNNEMMTGLIKMNNEAKIPTHMGFVFDQEPVENEIAACANVVVQYLNTLKFGQLESVEAVGAMIDEFVKALEDNGVRNISDEVQSQIDAWAASN